MIRIFFPNEKINVTDEENDEENRIVTVFEKAFEKNALIKITVSIDGVCQKREGGFCTDDKLSDDTNEGYFERKLELMLYEMLCELTHYTPAWGILTGVRPAKLMTNLLLRHSEAEVCSYFVNELRVSEEKTRLALSVSKKESPIIEASGEKSFSLYISIPFCPSRCSYCSFVSHSNDKAAKLISPYVDKLCEEIRQTGKIAKRLGLKLESIYMGGGTPTALDAESLKRVTDATAESFEEYRSVEYTIESGRPDSITRDKLDVIKKSGARRISINPQTFNDSVLEEIGRKHSSQMTCDAMLLARECGFDNINMDIIAGLPTDTLESFDNTLTKVLAFSPENVTVHTLALKRSSNLVTLDMRKGDAGLVSAMLSLASKRLMQEGYRPYYMYRQSKCLGNLENVGWAKEGLECKYNVYMMEECHTVLACGAGAVTKLRSPYSEEIERIFNYKYPYEYINGFDEMLKRKERILSFYGE